MSIQITSGPAPLDQTPRDAFKAILNGWRGRCPCCCRGRIYAGYLKVQDSCPVCATELHHQRADDAPPYFTMLIVGHVLVGGALALEQSLHPSVWVHMAIWMPLTVLMSLWLLPRIKGALIGLQWAYRMHGFGPGRDPAMPDPIAAGGPGPVDGGGRS